MSFWTAPSVNALARAGRWDAEAFSPQLLELDTKFRSAQVLSHIATVTHPAEIIREYSERADSTKFLLAQNIRPVLPETSVEFRIPNVVAQALPSNRLEHGDVLVTRSGANSGTAAVYLGETGQCYTSGEGLIVRPRRGTDGTEVADGAYIAVFLNTVAGQAFCRRAIYGSGQPHIGPKYLELMRVPRLGKVESHASRLVRQAHAELQRSGSHYPEAERELLDRLGWDELSLVEPELTYSRSLREMNAALRVDPEYFQPRHTRIAERLASRGSMTISSFCAKPTRGVQPKYVEGGEIVVIDSKAVRPNGVEPGLNERTSAAFSKLPANRRALARKGDVLLNSTGRGTLGRSAPFTLSSPAFCDNHVAIIRPDTNLCVPTYLSLFLNSPAGRSQTERMQTGSSGQLEIYPEHIQKILVFLPKNRDGSIDVAWQRKLVEKVESAATAKRKARLLIQQALELVESSLASFDKA